MDYENIWLPSNTVNDAFAGEANDNLFDHVDGEYDDEVLSLIVD